MRLGGGFRLGLQSESEILWDGPHTSSDMETAPLVEVAYSILVGGLIRWSNFTGAEMYLPDSDCNPSRNSNFTGAEVTRDRSSTLIRKGPIY